MMEIIGHFAVCAYAAMGLWSVGRLLFADADAIGCAPQHSKNPLPVWEVLAAGIYVMLACVLVFALWPLVDAIRRASLVRDRERLRQMIAKELQQ